MTELTGNNKTAVQVATAVAAGGAVYFVARRYLFPARPPAEVDLPGSEQAPTEIVPVPEAAYAQTVGPSGIIGAYDGPTSAPWYANGITIPVTPTTGTGTGTDTGTGTGTGTGTDTGTGTSADDGLNWGAVIGGDEFNYTAARPDPAKGWGGPYSGADPNGGTRQPGNLKVTGSSLLFTGNGGIAYKGTGSSRKTYRAKWRIRMSGTKGHPVLIWWPDAENWPVGGEDDVMETNLNQSGYGAFIHKPNQGSGSSQYAAPRWNGDHTQWHIVAFERSATQITCWVDGAKWYSVSVADTNGPPPGPMHPTIQLDQECSSDARFEIDYIRLYAAP